MALQKRTFRAAEAPTRACALGRIDARPRVVAAITEISEELAMRGKNSARLITDALTNALALEIDRAGFLGLGAASEPTGVINWPGITATNNSGTALAPDNLIDWGSEASLVNGPDLPEMTMISTPAMAKAIRKFKEATTNAYLQPQVDVARMRKLYTNQLRSTLGGGSGSEFIFGDFSQMALVSSLDIKVETGHAGDSFKKLTFYVRAWAMVDSVVFRPAFFHHVSDVTA